jgi:hypothetical protein
MLKIQLCMFVFILNMSFMVSHCMAGDQYIMLNITPEVSWDQNSPNTIDMKLFEMIKEKLPNDTNARIKVGVSFIFSYFKTTEDKTIASLRNFLKCAAQSNTPIVIHIEGENWWQARPDLWNWWDPTLPGYDPNNHQNVEWTGWSPEYAVKIGWRNWGRQLRVCPAPNLMSPRFREESHKCMVHLISEILNWWKDLPAEKKSLFVGLKVGHENAIGTSNWYYPNGNDLILKPQNEDPQSGLVVEDVLSRGQTQIGYAALKTSGIRSSGDITEEDLARVVQKHVEDISEFAAKCGVPRDKLFTHVAGWKDGELLYDAAVNKFSCPGWSVYKYAADPSKEIGIQRALKKSDAPYWAANEWFLLQPLELKPWQKAFESTLADPKCRYLCIFNWEVIKDSQPVIQAIRAVTAKSIKKDR